jgi:hypothetical protein
VNVSVRHGRPQGHRLAVDATMVVGTDHVTRIDPGTPATPPRGATDINVLGGGLGLGTESPNLSWRVNALGGALSRSGERQAGPALSATMRVGAYRGWFWEAMYGEPEYVATTGEFAYGGLGYTFGKQGPRLMVGTGHGTIGSFHVPLGPGLEVDATFREGTPERFNGGMRSWTFGARTSFGRP